MNYCPCCSNLLLKHIRNSHSYWFCRTCWQEMPVMSLNISISLADTILDRVSDQTNLKDRQSQLHKQNLLMRV